MNVTFWFGRIRCLLLVVLAGLPAVASFSAPAPKKAETIDLGDGVRMEFVLIPSGSFLMGSEENRGDGDESPVHRVTLTQPFYLGLYEVTQEQWEKIMGGNPSKFKGAKLPVDSVSWHDCQRFLVRLSEKTGRKFVLPTEAQWEYACGAGATTPWNFGDQETLVKERAWMGESSGGTTHPVGMKSPNAWGLHDMHGNVWEWCADWYAKHAYAGGEVKDPRGPATGESRVLRGGGWGEDADHVRSACRNCNGPDGANQGTGLRCVMLVEGR
jgi:formylglycine-generating enzyme required for sulfatase activity